MTQMEKEMKMRSKKLNEILAGTAYEISYTKKISNNITKDAYEIKKVGAENGSSVIVSYQPKWYEKPNIEVVAYLLHAYVEQIHYDFSDLFRDKEYILSHIQPMIVDESNLENIQSAGFAYMKMDCFLVLFYFDVYKHGQMITMERPEGKESEIGICRVTKKVLEKFEITLDELQRSAFKNLEKEVRIFNITNRTNQTQDIIPVEEEDIKFPPAYVITNKQLSYGAAAILLSHTYDTISKLLGKRFIVLPSSIHECIAIPWDEDYEDLKEGVSSINETHLWVEDKLCDHVFVYDTNGLRVLA